MNKSDSRRKFRQVIKLKLRRSSKAGTHPPPRFVLFWFFFPLPRRFVFISDARRARPSVPAADCITTHLLFAAAKRHRLQTTSCECVMRCRTLMTLLFRQSISVPKPEAALEFREPVAEPRCSERWEEGAGMETKDRRTQTDRQTGREAGRQTDSRR